MFRTEHSIKDKTLLIPHNLKKFNLIHKMKDVNVLIFNENCNKYKFSVFNQSIILTRYIRVLRLGRFFDKPIGLTPHIMEYFSINKLF